MPKNCYHCKKRPFCKEPCKEIKAILQNSLKKNGYSLQYIKYKEISFDPSTIETIYLKTRRIDY